SDLEVAAAGDGGTGAAACAGCACTVVDGAAPGSGASGAVCMPVVNVSVFTSTGRIGSVEPAITRDCARAALVPGSCVAAAFNRTGTLAALATAKRGSAFGSALASAFGSAFAATFGSGLGSGLAATFGSGLISGTSASANIDVVRLVDACAILSLMS